MVDEKLINEWITKADEDFGFASSVIEDSSEDAIKAKDAAQNIGDTIREML